MCVSTGAHKKFSTRISYFSRRRPQRRRRKRSRAGCSTAIRHRLSRRGDNHFDECGGPGGTYFIKQLEAPAYVSWRQTAGGQFLPSPGTSRPNMVPGAEEGQLKPPDLAAAYHLEVRSEGRPADHGGTPAGPLPACRPGERVEPRESGARSLCLRTLVLGCLGVFCFADFEVFGPRATADG